MGISYRADVVCGFAMEVKAVTKEVTKYDENTGQPYTVNVPSHDEVVIAGNVIAENMEIYEGEKYLGLEIFQDGYEGGDLYLGSKVAEAVSDDRWSSIVNTDIPDLVTAFAKEHDVEARIFLVMSAG